MIVTESPTRQRRRRAGYGLVEMAMTGFLIAAAMAATLQVIGWVALERRAGERRERAVAEVANLMERVAARPWEELENSRLASLKLNETTARFLPGPKLEVKVEPLDDAPSRKKITVELRWLDRTGRPEAPVRLVAWAYRPEEARR